MSCLPGQAGDRDSNAVQPDREIPEDGLAVVLELRKDGAQGSGAHPGRQDPDRYRTVVCVPGRGANRCFHGVPGSRGSPPTLSSRFTPGTLISSYEVYEAVKQGIVVPFRKSDDGENCGNLRTSSGRPGRDDVPADTGHL